MRRPICRVLVVCSSRSFLRSNSIFVLLAGVYVYMYVLLCLTVDSFHSNASSPYLQWQSSWALLGECKCEARMATSFGGNMGWELLIHQHRSSVCGQSGKTVNPYPTFLYSNQSCAHVLYLYVNFSAVLFCFCSLDRTCKHLKQTRRPPSEASTSSTKRIATTTGVSRQKVLRKIPHTHTFVCESYWNRIVYCCVIPLFRMCGLILFLWQRRHFGGALTIYWREHYRAPVCPQLKRMSRLVHSRGGVPCDFSVGVCFLCCDTCIRGNGPCGAMWKCHSVRCLIEFAFFLRVCASHETPMHDRTSRRNWR